MLIGAPVLKKQPVGQYHAVEIESSGCFNRAGAAVIDGNQCGVNLVAGVNSYFSAAGVKNGEIAAFAFFD